MAIALDSQTTATLLNTSEPLTWTHTPSATPDLIVVAIGSCSAAINPVHSSITYGASSLTKYKSGNFSLDADTLTTELLELWYCVSPGSGAKTVTVNYGTHTTYGAVGACFAFTGVNTADPMDIATAPAGFYNSGIGLLPSGVAATSMLLSVALIEKVDGNPTATHVAGEDVERVNLEGGTLAATNRIQLVASTVAPGYTAGLAAWNLSVEAGWMGTTLGIKAAPAPTYGGHPQLMFGR